MNRRTFLAAAAAAPLANAAVGQPPLCIFSKHMAQFSPDEMGKHAKQIGFDGVDLTVRPKGHVLPENAASDMPKAYEALRGHGLSVPMITTNLLSADEPAARPTLETAGRLKIPFWKVGYFKYDYNSAEASVAKAKAATQGLVALGTQFGVTAGFHNHSGDYVGAAVWDTRAIIADLDPKHIGYYFDPAHATIEGGLGGWRISLNVVTPRLKMVALKDFYWDRSGGKWKVKWCPMGEGMVDWTRVFSAFAAARFVGPLTLHIEYETNDELAAIGRDYEFVRKQLSVAYKS